MSSKKKDLEIIYHITWKNKPKTQYGHMSVVAVYDIPSTTLNFENFKSYLLKNSGISENDIKVTYLLDSGKEYLIQSQIDFQVALYAFRAKARFGEVINLMLERISDIPVGNQRHSNDAETQFDTMTNSLVTSSCCNLDTAPEWFLSSLAKLKKDITDDVTAALTNVISTALANIKPPQLPAAPPPFHHCSRKCKPDKRIRKGSGHAADNATDSKDLLKSIKLDYKLEKLERKASKYREKRISLQSAVKSSDSEAGHSSSRSRSRDKQEEPKEPKMGAKPVNTQKLVPHMLGGEIYLHQWDVQNTGEAAWNEQTVLQYTWGSKSFIPESKVVGVPSLKPGEKGTISVRFQIPSSSGSYECYWQFMHKERRFGHWLGCQVVVDSFDLKGNRSVLERTRPVDLSPAPLPVPVFPDEAITVRSFETFLNGCRIPSEDAPAPAVSAEALASFFKNVDGEQQTKSAAGVGVQATDDERLRELSEGVKKVQLPDCDTDSNSSDDENFSLLGDAGSFKGSVKDEFVVVPIPKFPVDLEKASTASLKSATSNHSLKETQGNSFDDNNNASASSGNSIKLRDEDLDNVVVITVPKDEHVKEGYIYVHVDGQKVLVPKNILKSEVVSAAISLETQPGEKKSVGVVIESEKASKKPVIEEQQQVKEEHLKPVGANDDDTGNVLDGATTVATGEKSEPIQEQIVEEELPNELVTFLGRDFRADYFDDARREFVSGSCFDDSGNPNRIFVFPENDPGYEAINPDDIDQSTPVTTPRPEPPKVQPIEHIPNFQQTPPEERPCVREATPVSRQEDIRILPEALVNGAVSVASSAYSTVRSAINLIKPQPAAPWIPQTLREVNLQALTEMGFWNLELNVSLLDRYNDDLNRVIADLVQ